MADRMTLLVSTPIDEALSDLDRRAEEADRWGAADTATTIRQCVHVVRDAMASASEIGQGTRATAAVTGWSENTLLKHAKRLTDGLTMDAAWRGLVVRRDALGGYSFVVSTVPACPREKSA
jgi:hypothetical protein